MQKDDSDISVTYCHSEQVSELHVDINPNQSITVFVPETISDEEAENYLQQHLPEVQKQLRFERDKKELLRDPYFCSWSEKQVGQFLLKRLDALSRYHRLSYRSASITFDGKIWGCCYGNGHIVINFNVAILPEHLRDYLFLHELVHMIVRNHDEPFWRELDKYTNGKAQKLEQEMHRYHMKVTVS